MRVEFTEVLPNAGFDRETPTGGPGMVLPYKGSGLMLLDGGKNLTVSTALKPMLTIDEIKDQQYLRAFAEQRHPCSTEDKALDLTLLKSGSLRLFKITANALVGYSGKIEALNPVKKRAEATLKVIVLKQKRVPVAIRYVKVRDGNGGLANSSENPADPKALLGEMNAIWTPQANVVFELTNFDPVILDHLKPGQPADITNESLKAELISKKDPRAALTFFMVKRAVNNDSTDRGVVNSEAGIALISDDRGDSTMAHEAGHFLGSLNESGKFSMRYGHQGKAANLLMREGGAGRKIPFGLVTDFNKGFRT